MKPKPLEGWRRQCPGDGERGCLTTIPATRERCRFCARTVALRKAAG